MRRLEFKLGKPEEEPRLSFAALVAFAAHLDKAFKTQAGKPAVGLDLTYFGAGGSSVLRLVAPEVPESDAADVLVQSLRGREGGRLHALRPAAAGEVRNALAVLLKESESVSVRDGWQGDEGGWIAIPLRVLEELEARSRADDVAPPLMLRVVATGVVFSINEESRVLKLRPSAGPAYSFAFAEHQFPQVDACRWKRARVTGMTAPALERGEYELMSVAPVAEDVRDGFEVDGQEEVKTLLLQGLDRLLADQSLRVPGWDGYVAKPLAAETLAAARQWLLMAQAHTTLAGARMPTPTVVPTRDGGVQFEWEVGQSLLEVEFDPPAKVRYLLSSPPDTREGETSLNNACELLLAVLREGGRDEDVR